MSEETQKPTEHKMVIKAEHVLLMRCPNNDADHDMLYMEFGSRDLDVAHEEAPVLLVFHDLDQLELAVCTEADW